MGTTSKKKTTQRTAKKSPTRSGDTPEKIASALDTMVEQWMSEHKDRDVPSLEELTLVSSLALLAGAKQWKVASQMLLIGLKVAETDPSVAETLRGALECMFVREAATAAEMEISAEKARIQQQLSNTLARRSANAAVCGRKKTKKRK